jgi:hypothetical protein
MVTYPIKDHMLAEGEFRPRRYAILDSLPGAQVATSLPKERPELCVETVRRNERSKV